MWVKCISSFEETNDGSKREFWSFDFFSNLLPEATFRLQLPLKKKRQKPVPPAEEGEPGVPLGSTDSLNSSDRVCRHKS